MQTIDDKPLTRISDSLPALAGAALAVSAVGAVLAFADLASPLRAPFTLFFLLVAPGCAVASGLRGLDPLGRLVASAAAAVALNLLVAQAMLATHVWSIRGAVAAVAVISALLFVLTLVRRPGGSTARRRTT
ncbi:hypothetical protein [Streptomyces chryseus]|uniref:Integral membrane protein n=1 Tax=Streptomyces chryseus TaxID=68186 RepID=A0ABQ3DFV7_9ACTN|nr:hypothetical protein [Streptomyces chryseus]GGW91513.1 hypothetical protein GCM10010353_03530 [Streptomyces chryseus]GHA89545.1 hypothetical protein GCM10010346_10000 [Streptomyces chryseus]